MTTNEMFSFAGFGMLACVVLPTPDGAIDSVAEYQQCIGLYALGVESAPAPTPAPSTTVTVESDDHSWFEFSPALLPIGHRAPVAGRLVATLPPLVFRGQLVIHEPARALVPFELPPLRIPVRVARPEPGPQRILGVMRGVLPSLAWRPARVLIEDPDEELLVALALEMPPRAQRVILVDQRANDERWLEVVAALLADRG